MKKTNLGITVARSVRIRELYHQLERTKHGSEWSIEEDALAFLTDAGLVGRLTMARAGRWPQEGDSTPELEHKLGECIWWLIALADRLKIDIEEALEVFLTKTEETLDK